MAESSSKRSIRDKTTFSIIGLESHRYTITWNRDGEVLHQTDVVERSDRQWDNCQLSAITW
ncbi:hypothetical protein J6590_007756 [Homalodisca vitripennis]|nr:hypothetical protein J6590_007756 [Homalodisca vitripennis]